jgi:hypothetical protein
VPFRPRVRAVVDGQRQTFESLGCIVEQTELDFAPAEIAFRILRAWNSANTYGARLHEQPDAFKETLKSEIEEGLRLTGADVARAETAHGQLWRRFQAFLEKYEYFVPPTTQLPPFDVNQPYPTEIAGVTLDNYIDWMKSCLYISATGNPAVELAAICPSMRVLYMSWYSQEIIDGYGAMDFGQGFLQKPFAKKFGNQGPRVVRCRHVLAALTVILALLCGAVIESTVY